MEDIDKLQTQFENIDKLLDALLPFVPYQYKPKLYSIHQMLEPLKHLKDMIKMMDTIRMLQSMMNASPDGPPDISMLSSLLNPEQMQMFEMFQTMQDMNM